MTLHRFFLPPDAVLGDHVTFGPEQARQIRAVLRLRPGEQVVVLNGTGMEMVTRLDQVGKEVTGTIESRRENAAEPATPLVLYQGLLKGAKFEMVLQKGTEIGVSRFVPVITERSVPGELSVSKQQRYQSIVREAAEQSGRGRLPEIALALPFPEAVEMASGKGQIILPWEEEEALHLNQVPLRPGSPIHLFVGPEGGFSGSEVSLAREAGAQVVTLGPRILRAETAAVATAALLLGRLGEIG